MKSFCYDGLNRLTKSHRGTLYGSCGSSEQDVRYDGLGNITYKKDVGNYIYDGYSNSRAGAHAVTNAGGVIYTYDNNGNMTSGDGRTLKYSTFDKPIEISKGGHTTEFQYGPDRSRYQRIDTKNNVATTTHYIGNVERIYTQGSNTITWRRNVAGAIYTVTTDLNNEPQDNTDKAFVYKDHLGSTDLITDKTATVIQSQSFDAWGQRRNSEDWTPLSASELLSFDNSTTRRGYTGHEHLEELGLIHMNGRVYDPKLARFLQADPFIQAASNTQSYNRYSYLMNNPLNATDPSGFFLKSLWNEIRPFVGAIVAAVLIYATGGVATGFVSTWYGAATIGAVSGAVGAAANNGSILRGAALGAFTGFAANVGGWLGGALASGIAAEYGGGQFGSAFISAGIGALVGGQNIQGAGGFVVAAVTGGVVSEVTGGKFKNGAATAAFMWALQAGMNSGKSRSSSPPVYDIDTGSNPDTTLGDGVGAVDEPEFSYSAPKVGEVPYREEVLVVGHRQTYAPASFNLNMTGRYNHAYNKRNAEFAAIAAQSQRIAEARSWDPVIGAANMAVGGSAAMLCGPGVAICARVGMSTYRGGAWALGNKHVREALWELGGSYLGAEMDMQAGDGLPRQNYDPRRLPPAIVRMK